MFRKLEAFGVISLLCISTSAYAADWEVSGRVTRLEPSYSDHLNIQIDKPAGSCPTGGWLFFHGQGATTQEKKESVKAVYAGLLANIHGGKNIVFYGLNQGCVIEQVHLLAS